MKAVIMAGGHGSRLRPLTCDRPKPMVPIANRPMMEHIVRLLAASGLRDILVTLHPMPDVVSGYFGTGEPWGVRMEYLIEERPLGTAGSVARARPLLDDTLVVISGDALTDVDLAEAIRFHRERGAAATLVLKAVPDPAEYGMVITDATGRVVRFLEKPSRAEVFSDQVNTGIYILEPHVLDEVEPGRSVDFSRDLFPELLRRGASLFGWVTDGYWSDIGTPEQYLQSHLDVLDGRVRLAALPAEGTASWAGRTASTAADPAARRNGEPPARGVWIAGDAEISPDARLVGPVMIGRGCQIEAGAEVGPYVCLGEGCRVGSSASVRRSVLWNGCRLGHRAELRGVILADAVAVSRDAGIFEGAVIGRNATIRESAVVRSGVRVWPEKVVEAHQHVSQPVVWAGTAVRSVVGASGLRGEANADVTPERVAGVTGAFASRLSPAAPVVVGHSGSPSARMLAVAACAGAASAGCPVLWIDAVSVPQARTAVRMASRQAAGAGGVYVQVSAGGSGRLRLWDSRGFEIRPEQARAVDGAFRREEWRRADPDRVGRVREAGDLAVEAREAYLASIDRRTRPLLGGDRRAAAVGVAGVAAGGGNRPGPMLLVEALARLGLGAAERAGGAPDGAGLLLEVDETGEQLSVIDAAGRRMPASRLHALLAHVAGVDQADGDRGPLRLPVEASDLAEQAVQRLGRPVVRTPSFSWALADPQPSSGPDHPMLDGVAAGCLVAALASHDGGLDAVVARYPARARLEMAVPVAWEDVGRVMRRLAERFGHQADPPLDGLKVRHPGGWALVRPDPDRPLMQLQVEAGTIEDARELLETYSETLRVLQAGAGGRSPLPGTRNGPS